MINILHLYYDIMNLYGENANVRGIVHNLELNNVKVNTDYKSINDKIDFDKYDIVYIGSGSEDNIEFVLSDLIKRKNDLIKYIENNNYLFLTGNSMTLFGTKIKTFNQELEALGIFNYNTEYILENTFKNASTSRIVGEIKADCKLIKNKIIGFQNRCDLIYNVDSPLFETNENYSNDLTNNDEGFTYKNVYASHIIGPLLIRNPYLLDYFLNNICKSKKLKYKSLDIPSIEAYKKYLSN